MFDIVIVGAGLVGLTFACAIAPTGLKVVVVDGRWQTLTGDFSYDGRASAIALGSAQLWQKIGVWSEMTRKGVMPIHKIRVTDGNYPLEVHLDRSDMHTEALGYVVENTVSQSALWSKARQYDNVQLLLGQVVNVQDQGDQVEVQLEDRTLTARLVVGADGANSLVRKIAGLPSRHKFYDQTCLVFTIKLAKSHHQVAYEWFQPSGPFALLPLTDDRCCVVWTVTKPTAEHLLGLAPPQFTEALQQRLGTDLLSQFGDVQVVSPKIFAYQPQWQYSYQYCRPRMVLIGDSAHTTHPVAGQGINLGIRDASKLAQVLRQALGHQQDIGTMTVLKAYQRQRYWDNLGTISATDMTNLLFSNQLWWWQVVRRTGLHLFAGVSPLRKLLMFLGMGLHYFLYTEPEQLAGGQEDAVHSLL